jgi:hypothetical protein
MKRTIHNVVGAFALLFACGQSASIASAQAPIPNGDFEIWNGNTPMGWQTNNFGTTTPITKTTDAHGGLAALRADVTKAGPVSTAPIAVTAFVYTDRPVVFSGYYMFATFSNDTLQIGIRFVKHGLTLTQTSFKTTTPQETYTQFSVPITWPTSEAPDTAKIVMTITGVGGVHSGSTFFVDDLALANSNGVHDAQATTFSLAQNYPNPFNPSTTIQYSLDRAAETSLVVYDVTGDVVATLFNEHQSAGAHSVLFDASTVPSGVYYYRLTSNGRSIGNAMQLTK